MNGIGDFYPAIREDKDSDKEKNRINGLYGLVYDDLLEHLEANDAMDLELNFE